MHDPGRLAPLDGLSRLTRELCAELRARLLDVGFSAELVARADAFFHGTLREPRLPLVRWWLERQAEPGAVLARLFVYDDTLSEREARGAFGSPLFDALTESGVLDVAPGGSVAARFLLHPFEDQLLVLSDRLDAGADAAMGPGGGTQHLGRLVPRALRGAVLDLGCGAGSLALLAARRGATRSVGVDVSPRAIEIARFNARLNDVDVELRVGDATEPIAGEGFAWVFSQPPFVARPSGQPERTFLFGGATGEELPLGFVGAAAQALEPGGRAVLLLQMPERDGSPLMTRLQEAIGGARVHVLSLTGGGPSAATQASVFASLEDPHLGPGYATAARRYLDHFASLGIQRFTGVLVALGNPAPEVAAEGRYALGLTLPAPHHDAESLERYLRGLDLIEASPEALDRERLRLSPHATVASDPTLEGDTSRMVVRVAAPGIGSEWVVGPEELRVLSAVDRAGRAGDAFDTLGPPFGPVREGLRALVRHALVRGVVVRPEAAARGT